MNPSSEWQFYFEEGRMNTLRNPPCVYLNTDTWSAAEGLLAFSNDNCSQNGIASLRHFAAHTGIQMTKLHIQPQSLSLWTTYNFPAYDL
jgi:hypothetical protein